MTTLWDFFDKIYVISIPSSTRKNQLRDNFKKSKIKEYEIIDFTPAKKTINDGSDKQNLSITNIMSHSFCDSTCENIGNNHLSLIKQAYTLNLKNVLIFEDDALFEFPLDFDKLERVKNWLSTNQWDMFYFGYCSYPLPLILPINRDVIKIYSPYLAHAYAINKTGINYIMNNLEKFEKQHIDGVFGKLPLNKYGIWKNICFQSNDPALFKSAMNKIGLDITFKSLTKFLEYFCICFPIIIIIIVILCYKFIKRKL